MVDSTKRDKLERIYYISTTRNKNREVESISLPYITIQKVLKICLRLKVLKSHEKSNKLLETFSEIRTTERFEKDTIYETNWSDCSEKNYGH